jgi:hypothetical protein
VKLEKQPYEMTANEFAGKFYQHGNLRDKTPESAIETRKKIQEEGFKSSFANVIRPINKWDADILSKAYATKTDVDYYVVPKDAVVSGGNGNKIKNGWKPTSDQIIQVRYDGQPIHEALIERAIAEGKLDPDSETGRRVLADYPDLQKQYTKFPTPTALTTFSSPKNKLQLS